MSRLLFFLIALATVSVSTPPVWATPPSQETTVDMKRRGGEDSDGFLREVERDIAANRLQESESRLQVYLKDHPDSPKAHYDLGYVEFRTHNMGSSIKELSKSLELNPANAEAHKILALDCSIIGRYDLAETELLEAARLKPESGEIHYFLARTYYTRGVYPLAKAEFQTAIRLNPSSVKAYSNLGITMEALGENPKRLRITRERSNSRDTKNPDRYGRISISALSTIGRKTRPRLSPTRARPSNLIRTLISLISNWRKHAAPRRSCRIRGRGTQRHRDQCPGAGLLLRSGAGVARTWRTERERRGFGEVRAAAETLWQYAARTCGTGTLAAPEPQ